MTPSLDSPFLQALRAVSEALVQLPSPSMIIGGVAVIAHGVPRLTLDIDATVAAAGQPLDDLVHTFGGRAITARIADAVAFARLNHVMLMVHTPSGTPIDVTLAWLPFEREALQASVSCEFAGVTIRIPLPEDLIVYKLVASRPRDLDDAGALLALHGRTVDIERVRRLVGEFAAILEDDERPRALERIIDKLR